MRKIMSLFVGMFIALFSVGLVSAVECNADLSQGGYSYFFNFVPTFFGVLAVIIIIGILGMVVLTISKPGWYSEINISYEGGFDYKWLIIFFAALGLLAITAIISIAIMSAMCGI